MRLGRCWQLNRLLGSLGTVLLMRAQWAADLRSMRRLKRCRWAGGRLQTAEEAKEGSTPSVVSQ